MIINLQCILHIFLVAHLQSLGCQGIEKLLNTKQIFNMIHIHVSSIDIKHSSKFVSKKHCMRRGRPEPDYELELQYLAGIPIPVDKKPT